MHMNEFLRTQMSQNVNCFDGKNKTRRINEIRWNVIEKNWFSSSLSDARDIHPGAVVFNRTIAEPLDALNKVFFSKLYCLFTCKLYLGVPPKCCIIKEVFRESKTVEKPCRRERETRFFISRNAIPENVSNSIIYAFHPMPMLDEGELGSHTLFLSYENGNE